MTKPGIEEFRITSPTSSSLVEKDEVEYFRPPDVNDAVLQDEVRETIVEVLAPHFTLGNKWQFAWAGGGPFWARILDRDFLRRVASHDETFGAGDALRVLLRERITRKATGVFVPLYEIVKVIEKLPRPSELSLFDI